MDKIVWIDEYPRSRWRRMLTPRNLTWTVVVLGVGLVMLGIGQRVRSQLQETARCYECENNLRQLAMALGSYHESHGSFPPSFVADASGRPLHSWRTLLLPYLGPDANRVYQAYRFDEPWDGPTNRKLHKTRIPVFFCPNHPAFRAKGFTSYVAVVGTPTIFPPGGRSRTQSEVRDGINDTILLAETATLPIHWLEPRDLSWDTMSFRLGDPSRPSISSRDSEGAHVAKVSQLVSTLRKPYTPETVRAMLTIAGGETIDPF